MSYYLKLYLGTLAAFLAIDAVWLTVVARGFYSNHLGFLLAAAASQTDRPAERGRQLFHVVDRAAADGAPQGAVL